MKCTIKIFVTDAESYVFSQMCVVIIKFCISLCFYTINLTSIEIYPTPIRQSGYAIGSTVANIFTMTAPYILYLVRICLKPVAFGKLQIIH